MSVALTSAVLAAYVVRGSDGAVDLASTILKFEDDLSRFVAERETEQSVIAEAIAAIFDQHKGTAINMPALQTFALQKLNAQPSNYTVLSERVAEYVRENSQGEVKEGVEERPQSLFVIKKGKGGGVHRRCDMKPKNAG